MPSSFGHVPIHGASPKDWTPFGFRYVVMHVVNSFTHPHTWSEGELGCLVCQSHPFRLQTRHASPDGLQPWSPHGPSKYRIHLHSTPHPYRPCRHVLEQSRRWGAGPFPLLAHQPCGWSVVFGFRRQHSPCGWYGVQSLGLGVSVKI